MRVRKTVQLRLKTGRAARVLHGRPARVHIAVLPTLWAVEGEQFAELKRQSDSNSQVAIVAPSMHILGGQAMQAERWLGAWNDDPGSPGVVGADQSRWPLPGYGVPAVTSTCRTLITQMTYSPLLLRELRHADVVHVFSASYFSFILAPLPAVLVARLYGKPVVMNYRSGEAPDHLRRSWVARAVLRRVDRNAVRRDSSRRSSRVRHSVRDRAQHRGCRSLRVQTAQPADAEDPVHAEFRRPLQRGLYPARLSIGAARAS